jgi:hypothetical protein
MNASSLRERLELIGGQFEIESAPDKGSRFVLSVPTTWPAAVTPVSIAASGPLGKQ